MTKNRFQRLKQGAVIQHKSGARFTVASVKKRLFRGKLVTERLTAVRAVEVNDPTQWSVVPKKELD